MLIWVFERFARLNRSFWLDGMLDTLLNPRLGYEKREESFRELGGVCGRDQK